MNQHFYRNPMVLDRSCHTALKDLKHHFHGTRWFVEGNIKACFDNINHKALVNIINNKKDARLTQRKALHL